MFLGLDIKAWLGLTVIGAAVSTIGTLLGIFIKDYFLSRSFEQWKQRQAIELLFQKYRDPLSLSALELASRIREIVKHYPTVYLNGGVLQSRPEKQIANSIDDLYFQRYKLISTAFRFSAFFAWLELYRQELTYLHPGESKHSRQLEAAIELIRGDLADGQLNAADDWPSWRDTLVFREELRAIGESMIEQRGATRTVMGYGRFVELLDAATPSSTQRWATVLLNFILDFETQRDFRRTRLLLLLVNLVSLIELLGNTEIEATLIAARDAARAKLVNEKVGRQCDQ